MRPKGVLAPLFYQRLGTSLFLRVTPAEVFAVAMVVGFYVSRFFAFYNIYKPYEVMLEPGYPGSNGVARAIAQSLEEVYYASLPMQTSLAVKNMWWWWFAGLPVERAAAYHAWHGYCQTGLLVTAWICYAIGGLTTRHLTARFCFCDINPLAGLIACICQVLITIQSLPQVRRKNWEMFYLMGHFQLLFPIFWGTLLNDRVAMFPYFVITIFTWGWGDMMIRGYMKVVQKTRVLEYGVRNGNVSYLKMTKRSTSGEGKTLGLLTSQWEPGSYIWIAVRMPNANPLKGMAPPPLSKDWACYHPMTITSPPIVPGGNPAQDFTIHVKSMGPGTWSQALVDKLTEMAANGLPADDLKVWVGGPNGKLAFSPLDCDRIVMCAGGIGVTPFIALAQELAIRARMGQPVPEMELVWVERDLSNFSVFDEQLTVLTSMDPGTKAVDIRVPLTFKLYCTRPGTAGEGGTMSVHDKPVTTGRPKYVELLAAAASPVNGATSGTKPLVGVYSCGPPAMMAAVRAAVHGASSKSATFYLHEETFEL